tara:strand:+ start:165 stop:602 length:438 start_codon:yes stop_codon:yes gene_type:complete
MKKDKEYEKLEFPKGFTLLATGNDGYRHRYYVEKNKDFKKIFIKFMIDLGFEEEGVKKRFQYYDDKSELVVLKITEIVDECWNFNNKKYDVDVFIGKKKVIIVVRTSKRRKMLDNLESKSKWRDFPKLVSDDDKSRKRLLQRVRR